MPLESDARPASPGEVLRSCAFYACFYAGSVGYVLLAMLLMAVWPRGFRQVVDGWSHYHRACCRWLLGIRVRCEGGVIEGPALYAIRHESFFEAIDLPRIVPMPVIFAKVELMRLPLWGIAAQRYGVVPVRRDGGAKALRGMVNAAKDHSATGRPLAIFPEGTRVPYRSSPPLQSGFAGLYKLLGMPVVPVAVDSGRLYHRWWKRAGVVTYRFGEPIAPGLPRAEVERRVHAAINTLHD
jgi:1-acyl-sn-glycerol-3-phosphate acyltransferase